MEQQKPNNEKSGRSRWKRWMIMLLVFAVVIGGVRHLLRSDFLFDKLRDIAVEQAGKQLNGSLEINSIRGDLLYGFTITGISLSAETGDEILTVDSLAVQYRLSDLLRSPHTLQSLQADGVSGYLSQDDDSVWNVERLVRLGEPEVEDEESETFWGIDQLSISRLNLDVHSDLLLPDGFLNIRDLQLDMSAGQNEQGFFATLRSLDLMLEEARLPEPVDFAISGSVEDNRYTLESLVINSSRTLISASANFRDQADRELEARSQISPLAWQDMAAYLEDLPLQQDLDVELSASGKLTDFDLSLKLSAPGLENVEISAGVGMEERPEIKRLMIAADRLDAPLLTGLQEAPKLIRLTYDGRGSVWPDQPELSVWEGDLMLEGLQYDHYAINRLTSTHSLDESNLDLAATILHDGEEINVTASAGDIWGELPVWQSELQTRNLNLATWLNNPDLESDLNIHAAFSGRGTDPDRLQALAEINVTDSRYGEQPFSEAGFRGNLSADQIRGFFHSQLDQSRLTAEFSINEWQRDPQYTFVMALSRFNTAELVGGENFPTDLNGVLEGEGRSFDPEQMVLSASARFDSSFVNREEIDRLMADFRIENSTLFVDEAALESPIADVSFIWAQHLFDRVHPANRMNFTAELKNIQPLAPLLGLQQIEALGSATGELAVHENGNLQFTGDLNLNSIQVDTLFATEALTGSVRAQLADHPEAELEIELTGPSIDDFWMETVKLTANARQSDTETTGQYRLEVVNRECCSLNQAAEFRVDSLTAELLTTELQFTTEFSTLTLQQPFMTEYRDEIVRIDTMTVQNSDGDTYLSFWATELSAETQQMELRAGNLNLGAMQNIVIEEPLADGFLSGRISILNSPDELAISATGQMSDLTVGDGTMNHFEFDIDLADEWLTAELKGEHRDQALFAGNVRIPFLPGDPLEFDDRFFDQPVEGFIEFFDTDISYWMSFVPDAALESEEWEGVLGMRFDLSGEAGNPALEGHVRMRNGLLSGIEVNAIDLDLVYRHEEEYVDLVGEVIARDNPVLAMQAHLPFKVDLRSAEIILPDEDDEVMVSLETNNFNLALFSDFLDRDMFRQLRGRIDGQVTLSGPISDLNTDGRLELRDGNVRVVPAGIVLQEAGAELLFGSDRVTLSRFSMRSGPGRMRASGYVELDNLTAGELNLTLNANQFRLANTSEYNALIDLSASLSGSVEEPDLTGNLTFLSGFVNLQNFGERAVEDVRLEDEPEPEPIEFYEALAMEMNVRFARQFFIRNRQYLDMEIELGGDVDLVKARDEELQMFGSLEGVRGYARPLGKNFELDEAVVTFFGPVDDPELNITTRFDPPQAQADVRIFYIIEGTVQDPTFRFDSQPQLELQDIISYTLFGKPFYELESWEQVVAGTGSSPTAADVALDVLLDRVELLAAQSLGIDVVQIDNTRSGSSSTTSIKTGWYLNRRTFFAVLNEISSSRPKTLFMLEYLLQENLELIITQGDDSREGIDLRWRYDY
jgi:hypothetical protein